MAARPLKFDDKNVSKYSNAIVDESGAVVFPAGFYTSKGTLGRVVLLDLMRRKGLRFLEDNEK
ncbi:hypothetical protein [Serratia sp. Se-RSBMAAmG]|uniref:hypothetical protein n=1 Tax=Serratia sp. Se-RSBMAAmG TaxID=3043305 RepID=UPI0024AF61EF|nr:hypothetical protein [Serratia sp. Se-RSBMAAmG]MDI6975960.1 hypothetical protein [Serratia sp. Se-RSBMAAmG]